MLRQEDDKKSEFGAWKTPSPDESATSFVNSVPFVSDEDQNETDSGDKNLSNASVNFAAEIDGDSQAANLLVLSPLASCVITDAVYKSNNTLDKTPPIFDIETNSRSIPRRKPGSYRWHRVTAKIKGIWYLISDQAQWLRKTRPWSYSLCSYFRRFYFYWKFCWKYIIRGYWWPAANSQRS